jgi:Fur family ferric uptake transcriptional regulator/Fur family peroxide stress response transcriptional regulator
MATERTDSPAELDRHLAVALRERGQRVTSQRLLIHRALRELDRHVTAEEVLAAVAPSLPSISLPTVYATLELFVELGIVRRVRAGEGAVRFDPRSEGHHHLACRRCGRVEDLDVGVDFSPALRAAARSRFAPESAELVLSGLCAACAAQA